MTRSRKTLVRLLDAEVSRYVRLRDALETTGTLTHAQCCTCGKVYPAFGPGCIQAGHFIPGRGGAVRNDLRGIHAQCYVCNVVLKGNWVEYERYMLTKYGPEIVAELKANKFRVKKWSIEEMEEMLAFIRLAIKATMKG